MIERSDTLRARLVDELTAEGSLRTTPWRRAFAEVPRHVFLPRFFRQTADHTGW